MSSIHRWLEAVEGIVYTMNYLAAGFLLVFIVIK